jgi:hypothetical protein
MSSAAVDARLAHLRQEHHLLSQIVVRNYSQHRRTKYFAAFKRAHKITLRILQRFSDSRSRTEQEADTAVVFLEGSAKKLLLLSREVGRSVTGGGFATLHAVLLGGIATYLSDTLSLRDAFRHVA